MYSDIVNVKAPEDDWSSAGPTESKSDPFVPEGGLVTATDLKQELSSEEQDEPSLLHNDIVLSTSPAPAEVDQPSPARHTGLRDALSHFEQAALSRESVEDLPIQSQSNDISPSGEEISPVCAEKSTEIPQREKADSDLFGPVFHPSPNYRPLTPSRLEPWAHPIVFRREPPPPAPEQPSLAPSHTEREKEPVLDEPPPRTPTPPYQNASVQRTRMIRLMIEKFGPDWVPVEEEEQSDDERDGGHEDSYEESEDDGMHLLPGDRNNVRAFFDIHLQLREAARVERGEPPHWDSSLHDSDVQGQENIISREELIELGVPTVRLVTSKPEPDVPLPFH